MSTTEVRSFGRTVRLSKNVSTLGFAFKICRLIIKCAVMASAKFHMNAKRETRAKPKKKFCQTDYTS